MARGKKHTPEQIVSLPQRGGKLLSLERRRCAVDHAQEKGLSEMAGKWARTEWNVSPNPRTRICPWGPRSGVAKG
jgi:hypothetical protein